MSASLVGSEMGIRDRWFSFLRQSALRWVTLGSGAPTANDRADCGLEDCTSEPATSRFRGFGLSRSQFSSADSDSARTTAQNAP
eukprot:194797-Alexandrium_andersonii.AAC.1